MPHSTIQRGNEHNEIRNAEYHANKKKVNSWLDYREANNKFLNHYKNDEEKLRLKKNVEDRKREWQSDIQECESIRKEIKCRFPKMSYLYNN